ncbi:MAG TPA: hypothetical protein VGJ05_08915 [Fimbriiglobus sp.]|jgi:hypothetical protein
MRAIVYRFTAGLFAGLAGFVVFFTNIHQRPIRDTLLLAVLGTLMGVYAVLGNNASAWIFARFFGTAPASVRADVPSTPGKDRTS